METIKSTPNNNPAEAENSKETATNKALGRAIAKILADGSILTNPQNISRLQETMLSLDDEAFVSFYERLANTCYKYIDENKYIAAQHIANFLKNEDIRGKYSSIIAAQNRSNETFAYEGYIPAVDAKETTASEVVEENREIESTSDTLARTAAEIEVQAE